MNDHPIIPETDDHTGDPLTNGATKKDNVDTNTLPLPVALRNEDISEEDFEALCRIAENPEALTGRLQRVPRGFPKDHEAAEYLKHRQFLAGAEFPATFAASPKFYSGLLGVFRRIAPLVHFLNEPLMDKK